MSTRRPTLLPESLDLLTLETMNFKGVPPVLPLLRGAITGHGKGAKLGPDDPGVLLYTSGTSGKPKGVVLTHGNLHHNVTACIEHAGLNERTIFLGVLPQFHSFGLTVLTLVPLFMAARAVYTARFVPRRLVELMKEHKPSVFIAVPSMWNALLSVKSAGPGDFDSLRYGIAGGEKLPAAVRDNVHERFGVKLMEGYGLTETSPVSNWSTHERNREGSVGSPLPGVGNWILDDAGQPVPSGEEGEIGLSGPSIMQGYFNLPELTEQVMTTVKGGDGKSRPRLQDRRHREDRRGRLPLHHRPQERDAHRRRGERLPARDRGGAGHAPLGPCLRRHRPAGRQPRRGADRLRRALR